MGALCAAVFLSGGFSAAQMTLGFVPVEDGADLSIQASVNVTETLGQIFVNGGFGYAEMSGGIAHGGVVFNNVQSQLNGSLFNRVPNRAPLPYCCCGMYMVPDAGLYRRGDGRRREHFS